MIRLGSKASQAKQRQRLVLADKKPKRDRTVENLIGDTKDKLEGVFSLFMTIIGTDMSRKLVKKWDQLPESKKFKAAADVDPWSPNAYYELVKALVFKSTVDAKQQVYGLGKRTLAEFILADSKTKRINDSLKDMETDLADLQSLVQLYKYNPDDYVSEVRAYFDSIESRAKSIKNLLIDQFDLTSQEVSRINSKIDVLIDSQLSDIKKSLSLQYQSSVGATDSESQLIKDLNDKSSEIAFGPASYTGSGILASQTVNDARDDAMDDMSDQIESYTFIAVDDDKTTEVCLSLDGTTFAPDDPNLDKYRPPLHYNCRSYLSPNLRSFKNNPEIDENTQLPKSIEAQIQLAESCCGHGEKSEHLKQLFERLRQRPRTFTD